MFNLFNNKKNEVNKIMSPVNGRCIDLSEVSDKVFAERMMGEGVAFRFDEDTVYSPCSGVVVTIAKSSHAVAVKNNDGVEVLIHIGVNTVSLKGKGFEVLVSENQKIKLGTPLVKIDREFMEMKGVDLTTPMIVTNGSEFDLKFNAISKDVRRSETEIIEYSKQ